MQCPAKEASQESGHYKCPPDDLSEPLQRLLVRKAIRLEKEPDERKGRQCNVSNNRATDQTSGQGIRKALCDGCRGRMPDAARFQIGRRCARVEVG
jgi:hypothetical protein